MWRRGILLQYILHSGETVSSEPKKVADLLRLPANTILQIKDSLFVPRLEIIIRASHQPSFSAPKRLVAKTSAWRTVVIRAEL